MDPLHFIAANAAMLLMGCALLFVAGLVLYIVGKVIQHKGERLMADTPEMREQVIAEGVQGPRPYWDDYDPLAEYATPTYPPV